MPPAKPAKKSGGPSQVPLYEISQLHLDKHNPRLGGHAGKIKNESDVLDLIVEVFGVDDVLSSIAVNGYFSAEPLIGVRDANKDGIRVVEGNRRLAACLILAADPRAKNQEKRIREFQALRTEHNNPVVKSVPVLVYDSKDYSKELLSYLGVRHIAASQPWDSYAKAAWVAKVLENGELKLTDVSQMIGDQHRTVARLLEGYYVVNQLVDLGRFNPRDSYRPGRGSNPEYPFSWIYTSLGYKPVRKWLGLSDLSEGTSSKPVAAKKLDDACDLFAFMFGNKTQSRPPVINDSRQISDLAIAIGEPSRRAMLKRGRSLSEVKELSLPASERVSTGLYDAQEALQRVIVPLSQGEINDEQASELQEPSNRVRRLAVDVHRKIVKITSGADEENEQDA